MIKVKICGITNLEDAIFACECGADLLGFIFYKKSPRYITPEKAYSIISKLPSSVEKVGVFVNELPDTINMIVEIAGLTAVQLHGEEPPEWIKEIKSFVIKAIRVKEKKDIREIKRYNSIRVFLLDSFTQSYGGSGKSFNWEIAKEAKKYGRIILSGGLTPENVAEAIRMVKPYGVDVSSGVERKPGKKDREKVREFIRAVRSVDYQN